MDSTREMLLLVFTPALCMYISSHMTSSAMLIGPCDPPLMFFLYFLIISKPYKILRKRIIVFMVSPTFTGAVEKVIFKRKFILG